MARSLMLGALLAGACATPLTLLRFREKQLQRDREVAQANAAKSGLAAPPDMLVVGSQYNACCFATNVVRFCSARGFY